MSIDTESNVVAKTGLGNIASFDADSKGNIYIRTVKADPNYIFKFDPQGRFLRSFGRQGQGPGEFQKIFHIFITADDFLAITTNKGLSLFSVSGDLIKEVPAIHWNKAIMPLPGENHLVLSIGRMRPDTYWPLKLYDARFKEIRELAALNSSNAAEIEGVPKDLSWGISRDRIAAGNPGLDYGIPIYDFKGSLIRTVKKDYRRIRVSENYKSAVRNYFLEKFQMDVSFPDYMPPFHYLFSDEDGRIYVMTHEPGDKEGESLCDIFNPGGVFISRKSLPATSNPMVSMARSKAKNGRLYCLREKASGYQELVVFRMKWE